MSAILSLLHGESAALNPSILNGIVHDHVSIAPAISVLDFLGIGRALAVPPADVEEGGRDAERLQTIFEELTAMKVCVVIPHLPVVFSLHCLFAE